MIDGFKSKNPVAILAVMLLILSSPSIVHAQEFGSGEDDDSYEYQPPPPPTDIPEDFVDDSPPDDPELSAEEGTPAFPQVPPPIPQSGGPPIPQLGNQRPTAPLGVGGGAASFGKSTTANKLRFDLVEGEYWEKDKKRTRGKSRPTP